MNKLIPILFVSATLLSGCGSNPYKEFYEASLTPIPLVSDNLTKQKEYPVEIVRSGSDPESLSRLRKNYNREGYGEIGYSSFQASEVSDEQLIAQAREVKATVALLGVKYLRTNSGSMPLTLPNTQTSYHSGSLTGYGGYGSYSGTSTTYGTTTTYIPYSVNRYEYAAVYLGKMKPLKLGVMWAKELPIHLKQKLGSNKGVLLEVVIKNGAAYDADILEGDVLIAADNVQIKDGNHLNELLNLRSKDDVIEFDIFRKETRIKKKVTLM